jgi:replicative DNA helicase Mcm
LKRLAENVNLPWKEKVNKVSLYNGKIHLLPKYLTKELLYIAGLIAGDGDIRKSGSTYSIRLSNSNLRLQEIFKQELNKYCLRYDIQKGNIKRPMTTRTHSVLFAEIFFSLGIPISPKSDKIFMSNTLLHLNNTLLASYIAGLYDSDGSICVRKTKGSDCIEFFTCSENLARQLQLTLLRYEIHSSLRSRKPSKGKIVGNYDKWVLTVTGHRYIKRFKEEFPLQHPNKKGKLDYLANLYCKMHSNIDIIPGIGHIVREELIKNEISLKSAKWHNNYSRDGLKKVLKKTQIKNEYLQRLAYGDIFWEKVTNIKEKKPDYDYVYDLTVKDSHNFVVDGVLVHNTAAVVKDEFMSGWSLEAGALVLGNRGVVCIDELDKMSSEDRDAMHEALEGQSVTISKANIQATLRAETTVLAAANPKFGRFDPYEIIPKQIDLPSTLINRFDLIFPVRDLPDKDKDDKLASFVLNLHQSPDMVVPEIDSRLLRKYFAYARQRINPKLTDSAIEEIKKYYLKMRSSGEEGEVKSIPISARQLEALIRMAEASARLDLSDKVTRKDAKRAVELMHHCLVQVGLDPETGKIDIDRISTGIPASERSHITTIKEIITELETKLGKTIPIDDIIELAKGKGIEEETIEEMIQKLKRAGDIFEPRRGFISKI